MVIYSSSPHHGLSPQRFQGCENNTVCEGGGTGRRARLRCVWFIRGGSSPLPRTKNQYTLCAGFSFCAREQTSNKAAAHSAASKATVQQRRPQPAAETGRSCWGRVLIFQSPAKGLRKNQLTQPVALISARFPTHRNVYQERCRPTHSSRVFLFWWTVQDENRDKQRQGITMRAISCLLIFLTRRGILGSVQQIGI